jgi:hypothetical protein
VAFKIAGHVEALRVRIYTRAYMKVADLDLQIPGGYGHGWHYAALDLVRLPKGLYYAVIEATGKKVKTSLLVL